MGDGPWSEMLEVLTDESGTSMCYLCLVCVHCRTRNVVEVKIVRPISQAVSLHRTLVLHYVHILNIIASLYALAAVCISIHLEHFSCIFL